MLIIYIAKGHWLAATFKLYGVVFLKVDFMQLHMCMSIVSCRSARVVARLSAITHDRLWSQLELHVIQYKSRGRRNCSVPPLPLTPQRGWRHCWTGREGQSSHRVHYLKVRQHCFIIMKYYIVFSQNNTFTLHLFESYMCNHVTHYVQSFAFMLPAVSDRTGYFYDAWVWFWGWCFLCDNNWCFAVLFRCVFNI